MVSSKVMKTARKPHLQIVSENDFLGQLIELCAILGWRTAHFRPAKTAHGWRTAVSGDGVGWPDLVLCRPGRLIFAELKTATGKLTPHQVEWIDSLRESGQEVYVWRPAQWDEIVSILKQPAAAGAKEE